MTLLDDMRASVLLSEVRTALKAYQAGEVTWDECERIALALRDRIQQLPVWTPELGAD